MLTKKRIKRKTTSKKLFSNLLNVVLIVLSILVIGFIGSSAKEFFSNSKISTETIDLSSLMTKTEYEKQTGHRIELEIWNGCGIPNLAMMYTDFLRSEGIDVVESKNADHFNYSNTIIHYHGDDIKMAKILANILHVDSKQIKQDLNENLFYDLTLIIGRDYNDLPTYRDAVLFQPPF